MDGRVQLRPEGLDGGVELRLGRGRVEDAELAGDDLEINEDAEPSADEEVDLDTGDSDLGVETETNDDEN
jgi:hypothetical protein